MKLAILRAAVTFLLTDMLYCLLQLIFGITTLCLPAAKALIRLYTTAGVVECSSTF
jgi:hypothetical protein